MRKFWIGFLSLGALTPAAFAQPMDGCPVEGAEEASAFVHHVTAVTRASLPPNLQGGWVPSPDLPYSSSHIAGPILPSVVAVFDGGCDLSHPLLADSVWRNPGEIPGNGIDDDRNGWVDDISGVRVSSGDGSFHRGSSVDHGTHVAGIIAGRDLGRHNRHPTAFGERYAKLMCVSMLDGDLLSSFERAVDYVIEAKRRGVNVRVVNASFGATGETGRERWLRAIRKLGEADIFLVAATANGWGTDMDGVADFPANAGLPNVVVVTSVDSTLGPLSPFASHGDPTVHVGTVGADVVSTLPGGRIGTMSGTSMATPRVAGFLARQIARFPHWTVAEHREALLIDYDNRSNGNLEGLVEDRRDLGDDGYGPSLVSTNPGLRDARILLWDALLATSRDGRRIDRSEGQRIAEALRRGAREGTIGAIEARYDARRILGQHADLLDPLVRAELEAIGSTGEI